jgi:hypothetical protein
MSVYLDAVSKAKRNYVTSKLTLEQRLQEQLREELSNLRVQLDIAVRYAHNDGNSKASILRAMGTKDYHTLYESLKRTEGVEQEHGVDPLDHVYSLDPYSKRVTVVYSNHGPSKLNGAAQFTYEQLADGSNYFMALTPMWTEDYTVKNPVVAALDQVSSGFYYEEALAWVRQSGRW